MPASTLMRRELRIRGVVENGSDGLRQLEISVDDDGRGGADRRRRRAFWGSGVESSDPAERCS